MTKLLDIAN